MTTYEVIEIDDTMAYGIDSFDTLDEANDFISECAGNDVTNSHTEYILNDDKKYLDATMLAKQSYRIMEK